MLDPSSLHDAPQTLTEQINSTPSFGFRLFGPRHNRPHVRFRRVQTLVREGGALVKLRNSASKVQLVDHRMRLGMRCRLSPTADVPSHTSGQLCAQTQTFPAA